MKEKIIAILMEQLDLSKEEITESASFVDDFEMDSLDMMEMVIEMEKVTGIKIENEKLVDIKTVGDLFAYVEESK
ncbi:MAG: acyl carrier protein [Eubacteriales bacterium]